MITHLKPFALRVANILQIFLFFLMANIICDLQRLGPNPILMLSLKFSFLSYQ